MKFSRKGKKNSTITAAVKVLEDISVALDKKQHCTFFFFYGSLQPVTQLSIVRRDPHVTLVQTLNPNQGWPTQSYQSHNPADFPSYTVDDRFPLESSFPW